MDLTLSYAPSDMITFSNRENGYTYKSIDFATIWSNCSDRYTHSSQPDPPCAKTITTEEANCGAQISSIGANVLFWQEHCYPQLSFPPTTRLQELNTAWKMCDMGNVDTSILGVFDPPRALKPGTLSFLFHSSPEQICILEKFNFSNVSQNALFLLNRVKG